MTFDQCEAALSALREQQNTANPMVRVHLGKGAYAGRVARADCDPDLHRRIQGPYGVLVLENLGLCRFPQTYLQIADIPSDGIEPMEE